MNPTPRRSEEEIEAVPAPADEEPPVAAGPVPDRIFAEPRSRIDDFHFGAETAAVFDDMLDRSVPYYGEIQRMIGELAAEFAAENTNIVDLGCSTGTTILQIAQALPPRRAVRFIGLDSSPEMLAIARKKIDAAHIDQEFELIETDMNQGVRVENASVVVLALTLQFVRPLYRQRLIRSIREGLTDNGCVILVEKVLGENSTFNRMFIKNYYKMKKAHGYSENEIAQKREALENVLVPYRLEENKELLTSEGFSHVDVFFKWYNFCALVGMK
ncbi:MAG: carboxy-S-adenosyl-L-methionine synthase CmoA [Acidobacteriota bacterium]